MIFFAFGFGLLLSTRRGAKVGIPAGKVTDLIVWLLISSLLGARLTYVIFHLEEFRGRWLDIINPFQSDGTIGIAGLVILGGVILALPTAWYFLRKNKIPFLKMMDVLAPGLAFGTAIGRIGCLLNGCCFGLPTDLPWGIVFPATCFAGSVNPNIAIHPTQIYATITNVLIGIFLIWRTPRKKFEGELFYLFFLLYGPYRFIIEHFRYYRSSMILFNIGDYRMTVSMFLSLAMILFAVINLYRGYRRAEDKNA